MISVICVYNNEIVLNNDLLKSLSGQSVPYELIKIDNRAGAFKSAASALNHGAAGAKGKYLMFVHQDVDLSSGTWLADAERMLDSIQGMGIAGVAGADHKRILTNIGGGGSTSPYGCITLSEPTRAQTLDECLVIVPSELFARVPFDERVCDDWHLYAVDACLTYQEMGLGAYVLPLYAYHRSLGVKSGWEAIVSFGAMPRGYYRTMKKLLKKHKKIKVISTTCGAWYTSYPLIVQRVWSWTTDKLARPLRMIGIRRN